MREKLLTVVTVLIFFLFSSLRSAQEVKTEIGSFAPELNIKDGNNKALRLSQYRGKYVILNFWSSDDPTSRIRHAEYSKYGREKNICVISVGYDRTNTLSKAIMRQDGIDDGDVLQLFDEQGSESENFKHYRLWNGYSGYLIDKDGRIVAKDPTIEQLGKILSKYVKPEVKI